MRSETAKSKDFEALSVLIGTTDEADRGRERSQNTKRVSVAIFSGENGSMIDDQIQALEALYMAAGGKYNILIDLHRVNLSINSNTIDFLLKQAFIRNAGRGNYILTMHGAHQVIENRHTPSANG